MTPSDVNALILAIRERAPQLGLTWRLRLATVASFSPLRIIYDGDTVAIDAFPLTATPLPGQRVYGLQVPPAGNFVICADVSEPVFANPLTTTTTTSTSFVNGTGPVVSAVFRAPASGRVTIHWGAEISMTLTGFALASVQVSEGDTVDAGLIVLTASADNTARNGSTIVVRSSAFHLLSGLVPGASYNVVMKHAVDAGTGTFERRKILVVPD